MGPKNSEKCYFTIGIQQGKFGIHFLAFGEKGTKMKQFSQQIKKHLFGPQKLEKALFYNRNPTGKIWHTFACFWRKRKENEAISNNKSKICVWAPKTQKSVMLQSEFNWENLAYIFLFLERKMKQF